MTTLKDKVQQLVTLVEGQLTRGAVLRSVANVQAAQQLQSDVKLLNETVRSFLLMPESSAQAVDVAAYAYRIRGATDMMLYQIDCIIHPASFGFGPLQSLINNASQVFSLQAVECTRLALCGELAGFHLVMKKHCIA